MTGAGSAALGGEEASGASAAAAATSAAGAAGAASAASAAEAGGVTGAEAVYDSEKSHMTNKQRSKNTLLSNPDDCIWPYRCSEVHSSCTVTAAAHQDMHSPLHFELESTSLLRAPFGSIGLLCMCM